ncbi:putative holin [Yersinia aldovae]|uniref:Phage holin n=1 Tax=Yersinia aldovae TaxID=29483 RepID=A0ABP1YV70_YERAL|nr:putative holin [Yersinia aldovae]CNL62641.1 Uncharacterised protein [Yersinia aldovae]
MTEPVSSATATTVVAGAAIVGLLSGPDAADIVVGAFIGSVIFVISAKDFTLLIRTVLFLASFVVGILTCDFFASIISSVIGNFPLIGSNITATKLIGAIVSSAVSVRLLMALTKRAAEPPNIDSQGGNHD